MELTATAQTLNQLFFESDKAILGFFHGLAESAGGFLTPFLGTLTLAAWKGAFLIVLALVLIAIPKTRRAGLCALVALAVGAVLTNVLVKNLVARPRPYAFDEEIRLWWEYVGSHVESDGSFPSGHMTATCAFCAGFILMRGKQWLIPGVIFAALMGASRMYLEVHYPSDVFFGMIFGVCAGLISSLIVRAIYRRWGQAKFLKDT